MLPPHKRRLPGLSCITGSVNVGVPETIGCVKDVVCFATEELGTNAKDARLVGVDWALASP
jgi:hypothetical protein